MILLRVLFLFVTLSICESSWIVLWGQPYQWSCCYQAEATNWTDCLDQCMDDGSCMFTYLNSSTCYLCQNGQIKSIKQESSTSSQIVAFKATVETCAVTPLTEYATSDYTVTLSNGYWSFLYTSENYIDETTTTALITSTTNPTTSAREIIGWECMEGDLMNRGEYWICMKVFAGTVNQTTAQSNCEVYGGSLSGIQTSDERDYIISKGVEIIRNLSGTVCGSFPEWVGAKRVDGCRGLSQCLTNCTPWANNAYQWTDGLTTLKTMMTWAPNQPNYLQRSQNCVQMAIVNQTDGTNGAVSGQLDDIACSFSTATANINYIRGYVCVKEATKLYD